MERTWRDGKIFGIGLSKTGTTSLTHAFHILGYRFLHEPIEKRLFNLSHATLGACDVPVAIHYKKLDKHYPNSKFIYTIRDKDSWLISIESHYKRRPPELIKEFQRENRIALFGRLTFNEQVFSDVYDSHDYHVRKYFEHRDDLMILNICGGDGWNKLLPFMQIDNQMLIPFPHSNKASII